MSTTTIRFELEEEGQLVDATSVAISAAGVVRKDTSAVVVAGGTALTRKSQGVYEHTFTDPVAGLVYAYSIEWVDAEGGAFGPIEMPDLAGGSDAIAAYNTLASARELAARLGLVKVSAATDSSLQAALERACQQIDARHYQGQRYSEDQERAFPRYANGKIRDWDKVNSVAVVPEDIKRAEVYQAESLLVGDRNERLQAIADGVTSQSIGNQSESYKADARREPICVEALEILDHYRLRGGPLL